jgi:hypothetical protein
VAFEQLLSPLAVVVSFPQTDEKIKAKNKLNLLFFSWAKLPF